VGIVTRNGEWCLPYCFKSLISQTIQPDEYVICIGPSNDKTEELVLDFISKISVPTKVLYDKDGIGTGYARNTVLNESTSKYLSWVDSDYILAPNWIEVVYHLIDKYNFDVLVVDEDNLIEITKNEFLARSDPLNLIEVSDGDVSWGSTYHAHVLMCDTARGVGGYDPFFVRGQDTDIAVRYHAAGIKGMLCTELYILHLGLLRYSTKILYRPTFLRFLYKYGIGYVFSEGRGSVQCIGFLIRIFTSISFLGVLIHCLFNLPTTPPLVTLGTSLLLLFTGVIRVHARRHGFRTINLHLFIIQLGKCIGEWYTMYTILTFKGRREFGYGKNIITKQKEVFG